MSCAHKIDNCQGKFILDACENNPVGTNCLCHFSAHDAEIF